MEYERRRGGYGRREGGGYGSSFPPKPVEVGEGIARIKGLVVFVPNTKTGDKVKIRITRISRRFCEAEVVGKGEPKAEGETEEPEAVPKEEETAAVATEEATEETETETETE